MARTLNNLADLYRVQHKYVGAEPLYQQALNIHEKTLKPGDPLIATTIESYAAVLRKMNRNAEAMELETRDKAIPSRPPE